MDTLQKKNAHTRDARIVFDEGPHVYYIDGDSDYMSVTTLIHEQFPKFDADKIIGKMMSSPKWPQSKYYGMSPQQIKDLWNQNGKIASEAGTKLHYDIECFYNGEPKKNESIEYKYFLNFYKKNQQLEAFRTEWMIFDTELKMAGSIDMVFRNPKGVLEIYDWKRSKEIKTTNRWGNATTECISHLPDCNFWMYSLQLNIYRKLLIKNYDVDVGDMYLVILHPNNDNYLKYKVPDLSTEVDDLFALRLKQLDK